jgi:hypothetical protein
MKKIDLPEFGSLENFSDLHDIVKQHTKKDLAWEPKISQISSMTPGQVNKFMEHLIKYLTVLQCLSANLIRYRE